MLTLMFDIVCAQCGWQPVGSDYRNQAANSHSWHTAIAVDNDNNVYVAYLEDFRGGVTVKKYDGVNWEYLGHQNFAVSSMPYVRIAVDNNNSPHVLFSDSLYNDHLSVMKFDGNSWGYVGQPGFSTHRTVDSDLEFDKYGNLYVVAQDNFDGSLYKYDSNGWTQVGSSGISSSYLRSPRIAIDTNALPFISYDEGGISVSYYNGLGWVNRGNSEFSPGSADNPCIAIDKNTNTAYVAFEDQANGLKASVMTYNGSSWVNVGQPGFTQGEVDYLDIAIDMNGIPYVVTSSRNPDETSIHKFNGSAWIIVGNLNVEYVKSTKIAIDSDDNPSIVCTDYSNGLKATVRRFEGNSWKILGDTGIIKTPPDLYKMTVDTNENVYVAYIDQDNNDRVSVKKYDGANWEFLGSSGFSATSVFDLDIKVDYSGNVFVFSTENQKKLRVFDGNSWQEIDTTGLNVDMFFVREILLDSDGNLNLVHRQGANLVIKKYNGSGLSFVMEGQSHGITFNSLDVAFGKNNTPYIAYAEHSDSAYAVAKKFDFASNDWILLGNTPLMKSKAENISISVDYKPGGDDVLYLAYEYSDNRSISVEKINTAVNVWENIGDFSGANVFPNIFSLNIQANPESAYLFKEHSHKIELIKYVKGHWVDLVNRNLPSPGFGASNSGGFCLSNNDIPYIGFSEPLIFIEKIENQPSFGFDTVKTCNSYTWVDGETYLESNYAAKYTVPGGAVSGCDSIITLNLDLEDVSVLVVKDSVGLVAYQAGVDYQWLDCDLGNQPIFGENRRTFLPEKNGNYAVELSTVQCTITSDCYQYNSVGINEKDKVKLSVFPNPTSSKLYFQFDSHEFLIENIQITDLNGKKLLSVNTNEVNVEHLPNGIYFYNAMLADGSSSKGKFVKQ